MATKFSPYMTWRYGHAVGVVAGAADGLLALADQAAELPPTAMLRTRLGALAERLREAAAFLDADRIHARRPNMTDQTRRPVPLTAERLLKAMPELEGLYSREEIEQRTRGWSVVADDEVPCVPGLTRMELAEKRCPVHTQDRAPYSFADTVDAFLCHGDPHLEQMALDGYREEGRGALVHDDHTRSFGMHYVTLEEMLADRAALAKNPLAFASDWAAVIPAVEQYHPDREYVYVLGLDDEPYVARTIAIPISLSERR